MVCVTQQKTCERLIRKGAEIRDEFGGDLFVIHVAKEGWNFLGKTKEGDALEYLFQKAKTYGANLTVVRSQDVLLTLQDLTKKSEIGIMVLGESNENDDSCNIVNKLGMHLNGMKFEIVQNKQRRKAI